MFIFENDRGRAPTSLECIKAKFMYQVHLCAGEDKEELIDEVKEYFETIYKSISSIESKIGEDEVLLYVGRIHVNNKALKLTKDDVIARINKDLSQKDPNDIVDFIKEFTQLLADSFEHLNKFYGEDQKEHTAIHSLITLGNIGIAMPFIIKAYLLGLSKDEINALCRAFESILLRHRLIQTRADLVVRLDYKNEFTDFKDGTGKIIETIEHMKYMPDEDAETSWHGYWHDIELQKALEQNRERNIDPSTAKFVLWKYENYLRGRGKKGYRPMRFDDLDKPQLEHIAPKKPKSKDPEEGYDEYDDEFTREYLDSLGNYLLIPKLHNASIGNKPFADKRESYNGPNSWAHHREVVEMTEKRPKWTRKLIQKRKEKIIQFILAEL